MKYKFSQVTKKSVSLLLAILMMFSMLTIGITANAADTYYIHWGENNSFGNNEQMTSSGADTYSFTLSLEGTNVKRYFIINGDSTNTSNSIIKSADFTGIVSLSHWRNCYGYNSDTYKYVEFEAKSTVKIKVVFNSTTGAVTLTEDTGSTGGDTTYNVTTGVKVSTDGTTYNVSDAITAPTGGGDTVSATTGTTLTASTPSDYTFVGWEVSGGAGISGTNTSVSYTPTANTTVYALYKKNYTVTIGTHDNGTITIDDAASNKTVPAGTEVTIVASPSNGYEFSAWTGDLSTNTNATVTMNVVSNITADATFTATSTPATNYYFGVYNSNDTNNHHFALMTPTTSGTNTIYTYTTKRADWVNNNGKKFKITTAENNNSLDNDKVVDDTYTLSTSTSIANKDFYYDKSNTYGDLVIDGNYGDDYVIEFNPTAKTVKLWTKTDYEGQSSTDPTTPTLTTPKLKGEPFVIPNGKVKFALDNQKDFGTPETNEKGETGNYNPYDGLTLEFTVTASDDSEPTVTTSSSGKLVGVDDTVVITAGNTEGVTYTVTVTASATNYNNSAAATATTTVCTITNKLSDRIYAYAAPLEEGALPTAYNAWSVSETAAAQQKVYINKGDTAKTPSLGATTDTNIRIFLPTTASSSEVVLYNTFGTKITVNGTGIESGKYATVSYTPKSEMTVTFDDGTANKKLTIYKSEAQGALYLNHTGEFAGTDNNVLKMLTKLYSDKENGAIGADNAGAVADSKGKLANVTVKKIKGRGNSTWRSTDKKSFNVNFNENLGGKYINSTFMGKKYSLLANFKDPSLSRNKILYALGDYMEAKYSPDVATIDLYMNGMYMGNYLMTQKVDIGSKELVNNLDSNTLIEEKYGDFATALDKTDEISNGFSFMMELDTNAGTGDFHFDVTRGGFTQTLTIKEPEYLNKEGGMPEDALTSTIETFIGNRYKELIDALQGNGTLSDIIDVPSLARYMMLNELAKNYDIGVSSTYFVYNNTEKKFYISPVWDLDVTTGNCDKAEKPDYLKYEDNWTDRNSDRNNVMKLVFKNADVMNEVRSFWTESYYTALCNKIDELTANAKADAKGSFECNYVKWSYPDGFQGEYNDNVKFKTTLTTATYSAGVYNNNASTETYQNNSYSQTQFVGDWLKSRAAWLTKTYATAVTPVVSEWRIEYYDDTAADGEKHKFIPPTSVASDGTVTWETNFDFGQFKDNHQFRITKGESWDDNNVSSFCVSAYKAATKNENIDVYLDVDAAQGVSRKTDWDNGTYGVSQYYDMGLNGIQQSKTYIVTYKPGGSNGLDGKITVADKPTTTITNPSVELTGDDIENEKINSGTPVALTANITPAMVNGEVVAGDYKLTLKCNGVSVKEEDVTITATNLTKEVKINTALTSTSDTFTVEVSTIVDGVTYTGTSNEKTYTQTGLKDKKIYFDPSFFKVWRDVFTAESTVTMTVDGTDYTMIIDPDDVHALAKGVFRVMLDDETLAKLKDSNRDITFKLDGQTGDDFTKTFKGDPNIQDGYIYTIDKNPTSDDFRNSWSKYNVKDYVEEYPGGCQTYQEFEDYLREQKTAYDNGQTTDNIVYFDNSVSQWYNVYLYGWYNKGAKDAVLMKKLPYANIWYYDFGTTMQTKDFLFKDRAGESFGTNYQQTVDLVGKLNGREDEKQFVYNGNDEKVYLNFIETIETANPIFITANFYNCTIKQDDAGADKTKKYRAFNTEWKEFAVVVDSQVKTKAVDVYFDMHSSDATDIPLYHESTVSGYKMATTYTRLTLMPGSNIYHASIQLPYTNENGITPAFKFTKFVVGTKEYEMSDAVQPKKNCFTTGEVWYEFDLKGHSNTVSADKSTVSSSSSAKKLSSGKSRISSGANVSILPSGYSFTYATVKFVKPNSWTNARMVIGRYDKSHMISPVSHDGNVYTFNIDNYDNYDGFYFGDFETDLGDASQDYYTWANELASGHVTSKIQNQSSGVTYRLVSGSSGDVKIVPDSTTTTIYVADSLSINSNPAIRLYAWYTNSDSNKVEPLGNWNNTKNNLSAAPTETIDGSTYRRFDFGCTASTFDFRITDSTEGNYINKTGLASGKTYIIKADNTVNTLTTIYISNDLKITKSNDTKDVNHFYAWNSNNAPIVGDWPGKLLSGYSSVTINGKDYYVVKLIADTSQSNINFILNCGNNPQTGDMKCAAGGTHIIESATITSNDDKGVFNISNGAPVTYAVSLDRTSLSLDLYNAKSSTLIAEYEGFTGGATVSWTSSATGVAKVDNSGRVTAVGKGEADITVTYTQNGVIKSAICTVTVSDSTPSIDSFKVNSKDSDTITLTGTSVAADLTITLTNATANEITYTVTKDDANVDSNVANVSADGTTFTATSAGTYVVTATINGTDITAEVTITVNQGATTVTDHCGILGYNHVTATFDATNGGTIVAANTGVTLKGGYYTDDDHPDGIPSYLTGYKTNDGDLITVIYALVTEKTDASTTFDSTTSHTDNNYKFNGWTKDGNVLEDTTTLSDGVSTVAPVSYVANWSEVKENTYTFKYNYDDYNVQKNGIEYKAKDKVADANSYYVEKIYTVKVNVKETATEDEIKALYIKYAPRLESDYFNYSFDGVTVTVNKTEFTATGKAKILDVKKYSVSAQDVVSGTVTKTEHFYQNIVELTHKAGTGMYTVWKNENGAIVGYGNTYKFRITKNNITIYYDEVDSKTATERTIVNAPTYEFYTSGDTQRVRFNFLVDNYVDDLETVTEYGVLYFFTDKDGKPVDTTIAQDENITEALLKSAVNGGVTGIRKYDATELAQKNNNQKYIFAPTLSYTTANTDRYLRVFSYFKKNDGTIIVSEPTSCILGSIREAIS